MSSELFTLSNLKLIGLIEKYQKISTVYKPTLQSYSLFTTITRFFFFENRSKSFRFLSDTLHDSELIIKNLMLNSDDISNDNYIMEIINDYKLSCEGINNMCETYKSDVLFVCKLGCLLRKNKQFMSINNLDIYLTSYYNLE